MENSQKDQDSLMYKEQWVISEKPIKLQEGLVQQWIKKSDKLPYILRLIKCKICEKILWNPKECVKCGEQFCLPCIQQFLKNNDQKCYTENCEKFQQRNFSKQMNSELESLQCICPFKPRGCFREDIKYLQFEKHLNECQYRHCPSNTKYQSVSVQDHITKPGDLYGEYLSYFIDTVIKDKKFTVSRRFKQFQKFHQKLLQQFKGHAISPLPPKSFKMNQLTDIEFIQERQFKLQTYIQLITENPLFEEYEDLLNYLTEEEYEIEVVQQYIDDAYKSIAKVSSKISNGAKFLKSWWGSSQNCKEEEEEKLQEEQKLQQQQKEKEEEEDNFQKYKYTSLIQQFQDTHSLMDKKSDREQGIMKNIKILIKYSEIYEQMITFLEVDKVQISHILKINQERQQSKDLQQIQQTSENMLQDNDNDEDDYDNDNNEIEDLNNQQDIQVDFKKDKIPSLRFMDELLNNQIEFQIEKQKYISLFYMKLYKIYLRSKGIQNCMDSIMTIKQEIEKVTQEIEYEIEDEKVFELQGKLNEKKEEYLEILQNSEKDSKLVLKRVKQENKSIVEQFQDLVQLYYFNQPKIQVDKL